MKNLSFIAITIMLFTIGCNQNNKNTGKEKQGSTIVHDTLSYKMESFFKTSDECDKDTCKAYVAVKYPIFEDENLNNFVLKIIASAPFKDQPAKSLAIAADSFINEYKIFHEEFPESPAGYEWDQKLTVAYQSKEIISFQHIGYAYTGGAHGLESTIYHNLYRSNYQKITLKDILKGNYVVSLTKIAEEIFRANENLKPSDNLDAYFFENQQFALNDNFLITPKGLLFMYNPYEIKAYAFGNTELLIPYPAIKDLIADNGVLAKYR